ncbi:MAG: hypothetical protein GX432_12805 [Candidatus Atribacteria bacterium]|nr:hypothetical protein [Candidatus Atribacteria bacterium]
MKFWLIVKHLLLIQNRSHIFKINPHTTFMAPNEDENTNSGISFPLSKRGLGGFEFIPAPSLRGASYATWQSHPPTPSLRGASYATWQSHPLKFFIKKESKR